MGKQLLRNPNECPTVAVRLPPSLVNPPNEVFVESSLRVRSFAILGILVGAVACADSSTAPLAKTPLLRRDVANAGASRPTRFANRIKYSDKGLKNGHGRAGLSSLEARALLGRDGQTTLDISTGVIDGAPGTSVLNKIQIKLFAPDGTQQTTTNYNGLSSPVFQATIPGRARGSALEVKGNIGTIDVNRTDVVTLSETVKLRPDVSVDRITAPAQSQLGMPVNISAVISENNGDVGARADCVLAIDGVEAHRARGIWVDAGRSVSCLFSHLFPTTGTKQLTVSAVLVNPGDWSASNNSATQTINIVLPPNEFSWDGFYGSWRNYSGTQFAEGYWTTPPLGDRNDWRQYHEIRRQDSWVAYVSGHVGLMAGPLTFSFHDEIDGKPLNEAEFDPTIDMTQVFGGTYEDPVIGTVNYQAACTQAYRNVPAIFDGQEILVSPISLTLCNWMRTGPSGPLPDQSFTDFNLTSDAADVSYYAEEYYKYIDGTPEGIYDNTFSFNGDVSYAYGNMVFGNDYSFMLKISGSDQSKTASGTIHSTTFESVVSQPYSCYDFVAGPVTGPLSGRTCSSGEYRLTINNGFGTGTPGQ